MTREPKAALVEFCEIAQALRGAESSPLQHRAGTFDKSDRSLQ
ncbi:MAG TPA: hypothetical protein VMF32_21185 [Xanthobacteraceae bacterium]|nr:hypothetical protein [Xanthobacteraceae bacterium]